MFRFSCSAAGGFTRARCGFSLVEGIAVLVLIGILAGVALKRYLDVQEGARARAVDAAIAELNSRETLYWGQEMLSGRGVAEDAEIFDLVVANPLGGAYAWETGPERSGRSDLSFQGWETAVFRTPGRTDSPGIWGLSEGESIDFGTTGTYGFLQFYERNAVPEDPWVSGGEGITANNEWAQLLKENPLASGSDSAYELEVTATLGDWEGPYQGYGIFFNTTLQADGSGIEDGYAVQFDPGLGDGKIIVREWRDGNQLFPEAYSFADYGAIPRISTDRGWWTSEHRMQVEVQPGSSGRSELAVYLDGVLLFDDFSFEHAEGTTYTGLRSWGDYSEASEFEGLDVSEVTPGP